MFITSISSPLLLLMTTAAMMMMMMMMMMMIMADPRTQTVRLECYVQPNYSNVPAVFVPNFIATMSRVARQIKTSGFGVAGTGSGMQASFALGQCYGDLSPVDCITCFSKVRVMLPSCDANINARVYLDGCFLRSNNYRFFDEYAGPEDATVCSNATTKASLESVRAAVLHAAAAAPKDKRGFARAVAASGRSPKAHVLANCWRTLNASACSACLKNAAASVLRCFPASEGRALNAGCFLRYSDTNFLNAESSAVARSSASRSHAGFIAMVAVAVVSGVTFLAAGVALGVYVRKQRFIQKKRNGSYNVKKLIKILRSSELYFKFSTLDKATRSFHEDNKLGGGGCGTVYKGVLVDGREIAVKRLFSNNMQRVKDFYNEVNIISSMEHKNLVRLLGCNCSGSESILVYEYLSNQSLDQFIFDEERGRLLDWGKRSKIIIGIAEGLAYLHELTGVRIIHRDIKASNILLDSKFRAKIADFGLARAFQEDRSHISTYIAGTLGYMAPEYVFHGRLTEKADIYSFGVLLLEIVTGKQNNTPHAPECSYDLIIRVWEQFQRGDLEQLVDQKLQSSRDGQNEHHNVKTEALRVLHIGLLCIQESPSLRPTISEVLEMLRKKTGDLPYPANPPFIDQSSMELVSVRFEDL